MLFNPDLVITDLECHSIEEVLTTLGSQLFKLGYVKENFIEGVLEREKQFPTGLPTIPYGVAIPHTDPDRVIKSQIAFAALKNPVRFSVMGNSDQEVNVKFIFMMALKDPQAHLKVLQKLMGVFEVQELVNQLGLVQNAEELNQLIETIR